MLDGTPDARDPVASSLRHAFGADDERAAESLAFLAGFDRRELACWLERVAWLSEADRLAQSERLGPVAGSFGRFLAERRTVWVDDDAGARAAWARYLDALVTYRCTTAAIETVADHDAMLGRISGNMFCTFPHVDEPLRDGIYAFGALDRFWANLRDVDQDAAHGLCYFPTELLAAFGLRACDVLDRSARTLPGWRPLMAWWLGVYLPRLEARAGPFRQATGLHPALSALRAGCLDRHRRLKVALTAERSRAR